MAHFSFYWLNHYPDLADDIGEEYLTDDIDKEWMRKKGLRFGGHESVRSEAVLKPFWVDPKGMVYYYEDLKRLKKITKSDDDAPPRDNDWQRYVKDVANPMPVLNSYNFVTDSKATKSRYTTLDSAPEQQKKMAQDYIDAKRAQVLREGSKDANVYIRVVFEGPSDRNGEHNDVVIEEKLRDGNSNKPKEVYQIYVTGGVVNGSYNLGGKMVGRWITEPADPITPANPNRLQQLPTPITPWQPPTTRVPPIVPPRTPPEREPPPTVLSEPPKKTPPTPPNPDTLCLICYNNVKSTHWNSGVRALVTWLNKNPTYGIEIEADGDGYDSGNTWYSIPFLQAKDSPDGKKETFLERCIRRFTILRDVIAKMIPGFNLSRLKLKVGKVNGHKLRYNTFEN